MCSYPNKTPQRIIILGFVFYSLTFVVSAAQGQLFSSDFLRKSGSARRVKRRESENVHAEPFHAPDTDIIPVNYNVLEPPPTLNGAPTTVNFSVIVISVRGINEIAEELTIEMNLRFSWEDTRLQHLAVIDGNHSFVVLNHNLLSKIWHPDVYIDHAVSIEQPAIISTPASLRMYRQSIIRYSARLTVTMACRMDFHFYPIDTQKCHVLLKSYAYPSSITNLQWDKRGVFFAAQLNLPSFDVNLESYKNVSFTSSSGTYSNLEFTVALRRNISYQLIQTYFPSFIFVGVSWLAFLIPKEKVQERIGACLVTLLSLTVMFGSVGQHMPKVSYMNALHIWMCTCIIFVFLALCEFTIILKLLSSADSFVEKRQARVSRRKKIRDKQQESENGFEMKQGRATTPDPDLASLSSQDSAILKRDKLLHIAKLLEKISCVCLPGFFLLFNAIYWPWLTVSASK